MVTIFDVALISLTLGAHVEPQPNDHVYSSVGLVKCMGINSVAQLRALASKLCPELRNGL